MSDSLTIFQRIQQAQKIIADHEFVKDGKVVTKKAKGNEPEESYNFVSISQILSVVRRAHADVGITPLFGRPEYDVENNEKRYTFIKRSRDGWESTWIAANGHMVVRLYGSGPDDYIETEVPFEAQDNADKLTNKIVTNVERTLYRTIYAIDGDQTEHEDPEEDPESVNEPRASWRDQVSTDPFFGKKDTAPEPVSESHTYDDMVGRLITYMRMPLMAPLIKDYVSEHGTIAEWPEEIVRECFDLCVATGRGQ